MRPEGREPVNPGARLVRFACPECGAGLKGPAPGAVVPCTACGNPVVVPHPEPRGREPAPAASPPPPTRSSPYAAAALVLLVVAVAHVGLYLLLTAEARSDLRRIEARHAGADLRGVQRPGEAPEPGSPDYRTWREAVERFDDARAWRSHRKHVDMLRSGFLASFAVQTAITGWILLRIVRRGTAR